MDRGNEFLQLPVDWVLPVDVRSVSLLNLETPVVMISTPSLSPLAHEQNHVLITSINPDPLDVLKLVSNVHGLR